VAIRIDGPRAWDESLLVAWRITDEAITYLMELRNGALHHLVTDDVPAEATTISLTRRSMVGLVTGSLDLTAALGDGTVEVDGDPGVLGRLVALVAPVNPAFDIVVP